MTDAKQSTAAGGDGAPTDGASDRGDGPATPAPQSSDHVPAKTYLVPLATVAVLAAFFALCLISAIQLLEPRDMPFGVTGSSPVVDAVQEKYSLDLITYANQDDLTQAAQRGDIYGGYVPGSSSDVLVTVPAKSFFGEIYVRGGFTDAAKKLSQPITTTTIAPLPESDRTGAAVGLLLLPTLIGGYLIASLLLAFTKRAAVRGRIPIILGSSVLVALITGVTAGPILGAIPTSDLWSLIPCFALVTAAVALAAVAIQGLLGKAGTLVVAILFIVIGGSSAGGIGTALLPTYWQRIGLLFPPRHAIDLYRNVRYFDGNNITGPIAVLAAYALAGVVVIILLERHRSRVTAKATATAPTDPSASKPAASSGAAAPRPSLIAKGTLIPIVFALVLTTLFAVNYMSSGHSPVAKDMPFGVVGSTSLAEAAQGSLFSLNLKTYPNQQAATQAMDQGEIYGAIDMTSSPAQLTVVSSISDLSGLDITANFEKAAEEQGVTLAEPKPYAPTALAPKDPFALVPSSVLVPLLVAGYMAATLLAGAIGTASGRFRALWLVGFSIVTGLVIDLIVTYWLKGFPEDSFWIAWPILALIIGVVALFAGVLRRLLGPAGIILTIVVVLQFGNPSSGGANGVPYLPWFWRDIGPFLPPRNAYLLLRNTLYFDGHGIGQPLVILLAYLIVAGCILGFLDWFRSPELEVPGVDDEGATRAAAMVAPIGPPP